MDNQEEIINHLLQSDCEIGLNKLRHFNQIINPNLNVSYNYRYNLPKLFPQKISKINNSRLYENSKSPSKLNERNHVSGYDIRPYKNKLKVKTLQLQQFPLSRSSTCGPQLNKIKKIYQQRVQKDKDKLSPLKMLYLIRNKDTQANARKYEFYEKSRYSFQFKNKKNVPKDIIQNSNEKIV